MTHPKQLVLALVACCAVLQGCTVIAAVDTVGSLAVRTAGVAASTAITAASVAADASITTTKIGVKAVGAVVDAAIPDK
jgi:hypothetical protein